MTCINGGTDEIFTTQALHTYYRVSDISHVSVHGLEGTPFLDNLSERVMKPGTPEAITISEEVDRIYTNASARIEI